MKQTTRTIILFSVLGLLLAAGCNREPPKPQAVIMNIGTIAREAGVGDGIKELAESLKQQTLDEIQALSARLMGEIKAEHALQGDSQTDAGKKKITALQENMNKQIVETRVAGKARASKQMAEARQSAYEDIMSVASDIARERGASIILKAASVFWTDDPVDITDAVVSRITARDNAGQTVEQEGDLESAPVSEPQTK